jgi:membrane protein
MDVVAAPPPIPGTPLDPPPKAAPEVIQQLDESEGAATDAVGVGYRAIVRFNYAGSTLLAAGTTYYVFLALFSLIALAYGVTAIFNADQVATWVTEAVAEAFPGLLGDDGIDPAQLRAVGQAASAVGLIAMLWAGSGAMSAASVSIHAIYGAPPDARTYIVKRLRLLGWLVVIGSLIALSLVIGTITINFAENVMDAAGIEGTESRWVVRVAAGLLTLGIDYVVMHLMLGRLGGIRPPRKALVVGSIAGAVGIQLLRIPMAFVIGFSVDKPQYGAFAVPIGVLLVLYLNAIAVYGAAALAAGFAERDVPLEELTPVVVDDDTVETEPAAGE